MAHIDLAASPSTSPETQTSSHWSTTTPDPNDSTAVEQRAEVLARAWRQAVPDRVGYLRHRVGGRTVLDIGCVAHDAARMASGSWLHAHLVEVSESCLGVDVLAEGVQAMREEGFDAIAHDLGAGPGPLAARGPFQVIVAGELIEHLGDPEMLFRAASELLSADGELIITTPNPYSPARVRAGQRGDIWENVDHVTYAFPSGIGEMAARHGLVLAEAMTTTPKRPQRNGIVHSIKSSIRGTRWHRRGFATTAGAVRPVVLDRRDRLDRLRAHFAERTTAHHNFVGETFIYVIKRDTLR